ncbi:type 1 glutamine amidotransferase domain-containing protein [Methanofollis fontis]|uniref:Protease n=1 Tax=Methanofollis fontis TaxID=2052832 RepID=A0A483CU71_9EURY|nr:type 1 glutamine amidotransferase domain-containing protein [Methanofollis fontis]TAJ44314.1 protease [Methanofollis fontis]
MKRVAVLIDGMFEDSEYTVPVRAIRSAGHEVVNLGLKAGSMVKGKTDASSVRIDVSVRDSSIDDYDALLIPGGYSPDRLRAFPEPVRFVRDFVRKGKPVFVICHGPQLLISARVLDGRRVTGWRSIEIDIRNAGADFLDQEVVVDGNLVSSRSPDDLPAFVRTVLDVLG